MKHIYLLLTTFLFTLTLTAQAPEKMSYQAVIRDAANELLSNTDVGMQISILQGSANGTAVYAETQTPTTNDNGLVSLEIGTGTVVSGTFNTIDWAANGPYFIKTETDASGGTNYTITGTSQLMSVPYAFHTKTADNGVGTGTEAERLAIATPSNGRLFYQTDGSAGLYVYAATAWECLSGACAGAGGGGSSSGTGEVVRSIDMVNVTTAGSDTIIALNETHHTIYALGEWDLNGNNNTLAFIVAKLPDPTTCPGREYRFVVNNVKGYDPDNPADRGSGQAVLVSPAGVDGGFNFIGLSQPPGNFTPQDFGLRDGRMTILISNGTNWLQVSDDEVDVEDY